MPDTLEGGSRPLGKSQLIDKRLAGVTPFPAGSAGQSTATTTAEITSRYRRCCWSRSSISSRSIVESEDLQREDQRGLDAALRATTRSRRPPSRGQGIVAQLPLRGRFRRPVEDAVLDHYTDYVVQRIESGGSFTDSMKAAASAALASPRFLYLYEHAGTADTTERLDDFELASRLSFFLWGSIPDETLLDLAAAERLRDPAVLQLQVERMLKDARLKALLRQLPDAMAAARPDRVLGSRPATLPGFLLR